MFLARTLLRDRALGKCGGRVTSDDLRVRRGSAGSASGSPVREDGVMRRLDLADLPVLAAPMAGGPTTPDLVAAASDAGSIGFLPAGYLSAHLLAAAVAAVRERTSSFGVNLFVPDPEPVDRAAVAA